MQNPDRSILKVANVADLATVDASGLQDGDLAYVETLRSYFRLALASDITTGSTTVVTVVDCSNGGQWLRELDVRDLSWSFEAAWEIDPTSGDDEATGRPDAPLKTWAEFTRRVRDLTISVTVTILGDIAEATVGEFNGKTTGLTLTIQGDPDVLASGTVLVAANPVAATNSEGTLTSAAIASWAAYVGRIVECTSGDAATCQTIILANAGGTAQVPFWGRASGFDNPLPATGTAIRVLDLPTAAMLNVTANNLAVHIRYLEIYSSWVSAPTNLVLYEACEIDNFRSVAGSFTNLIGCSLRTGGFGLYQTGSIATFTGGASFQDIALSNTCDIAFQGTIIYAAALTMSETSEFSARPTVLLAGTYGLGVFNAPAAAVTVANASTLKAGGPLYGDGNTTFGLAVNDASLVLVSEGLTPTITGTTAALRIDGQATMVPQLAAADLAVPAAAALTTWANWTAAPFYRCARNYAFNAAAGAGGATGAAIIGT